MVRLGIHVYTHDSYTARGAARAKFEPVFQVDLKLYLSKKEIRMYL
jgi:hypothetical protein